MTDWTTPLGFVFALLAAYTLGKVIGRLETMRKYDDMLNEFDEEHGR